MSILSIILLIFGIIVVIGIIRVIIRPCESFGDMLMDMFWLDILGDILEAILDNIDLD